MTPCKMGEPTIQIPISSVVVKIHVEVLNRIEETDSLSKIRPKYQDKSNYVYWVVSVNWNSTVAHGYD